DAGRGSGGGGVGFGEGDAAAERQSGHDEECAGAGKGLGRASPQVHRQPRADRIWPKGGAAAYSVPRCSVRNNDRKGTIGTRGRKRGQTRFKPLTSAYSLKRLTL